MFPLDDIDSRLNDMEKTLDSTIQAQGEAATNTAISQEKTSSANSNSDDGDKKQD